MDFSKIVPYLQDPLVLVGFFIFSAFSFARYLITHGIIPKLPRQLGYNVLRLLLLYGFLIGLLIILLGFGLRYRAMSVGEQQRAISLLDAELERNMGMMGLLAANLETCLGAFESVAKVLRHEGIPIIHALFPAENVSLPIGDPTPLDLANRSMDGLANSGLLASDLEMKRANAAAQAIVGTIDRTMPTLISLSDDDHARYSLHDEVWQAQLPILRRIELVDMTAFQQSYADLTEIRSSYDVVVRHVREYLIAVRALFDERQEINRARLAAALGGERLAANVLRAYATRLVEGGERLKARRQKLKPLLGKS